MFIKPCLTGVPVSVMWLDKPTNSSLIAKPVWNNENVLFVGNQYFVLTYLYNCYIINNVERVKAFNKNQLLKEVKCYE